MGGYGNPKLLCPDCDARVTTLTESLDAEEIGNAISELGAALTAGDTQDTQVIAIVTEMLEESKNKKDAIENGNYTPEEVTEPEEEFEITEELEETEEDRLLDEEEARIAKKIDTVTSWIAGAFFIATVVFLIIKAFF